MSYSLENARFQWEEGRQRLQELRDQPAARRAGDRIIAAVREELRRRLGSSFEAAELADLYGTSGDWASDLAYEYGDGFADGQAAIDAAYWEHLRLARDFSGGVRIEPDSSRS